jgi:CheY-like chemotaxis protein
VAVRRWWS